MLEDVWLILPFGIGSNMFKLLFIQVISEYNILFLIDYWYYCFSSNSLYRILNLTRKYFYGSNLNNNT